MQTPDRPASGITHYIVDLERGALWFWQGTVGWQITPLAEDAAELPWAFPTLAGHNVVDVRDLALVYDQFAEIFFVYEGLKNPHLLNESLTLS
jgi:hypothetical protein